MTRSRPRSRPQPETLRGSSWMLHDAKARFSEVVRRAREIGPQRVSVRGREEVVVLAADEYRRLAGEEPTGQVLIDAMQASPYREIEIEPERFREAVRVRDVEP